MMAQGSYRAPTDFSGLAVELWVPAYLRAPQKTGYRRIILAGKKTLRQGIWSVITAPDTGVI